MLTRRTYRIETVRAAPILADTRAVVAHNLEELSWLLDTRVKAYTRRGNLAAGIAVVVGAIPTDPAAPHSPDWRPLSPGSQVLVPDLERRRGRAAQDAIEQMDALHLLSALNRAGVNPWPPPQHPRLAGHVGVLELHGALVLQTLAGWQLDWPDWVREVSADEARVLLSLQES